MTYEQNIRNTFCYLYNHGKPQYGIIVTSYERHGASSHRQIFCSFNRFVQEYIKWYIKAPSYWPAVGGSTVADYRHNSWQFLV